jgi:hypothetical protein
MTNKSWLQIGLCVGWAGVAYSAKPLSLGGYTCGLVMHVASVTFYSNEKHVTINFLRDQPPPTPLTAGNDPQTAPQTAPHV